MGNPGVLTPRLYATAPGPSKTRLTVLLLVRRAGSTIAEVRSVARDASHGHAMQGHRAPPLTIPQVEHHLTPSKFTRLILLLAAAALTDCAQNPVSGQSDLVLVSETEELAIGRREDPKVRKQYGVYNDPALQQYVSGIGQRLAKASHRPSIKPRLRVNTT